MAQQLSITNVITISISAIQVGLNAYNTSNLAIFSDEIPANSFGTNGYAIYLTPAQVATDFGSSSKTYQMAVAVFSQQPNILLGGGALVVILITPDTQNLALSGIPASGTFVFNYGGNASAAINFGDTAAQIQTKLQAMPGLSEVLVTGSLASRSLSVQFAGVYGAIALATITSNSLQTSAPAAITITVTHSTVGETWSHAITRSSTLVQYFGHMLTDGLDTIGQTDLLAAANTNQALNKIGFCVSHTEADIQSGGMIDLLRTGSLTQMRGLFYDDSSDLNDVLFMAAYAGRGLSTNFSGSNTTQTMNLKQLSGIQPDPNITQTILNEAVNAGADCYVSIQGVPGVLSFGANDYFDNQYNLQWLVGALNVAQFNYLAQSSTKIPQTEDGMDGMKTSVRKVLEQARANRYVAPGAWNSSTFFGNQQDFINNIAQRGYYIFSSPVSSQSQADRTARKAPLIQIAIKLAGAIHSSTAVIYINP